MPLIDTTKMPDYALEYMYTVPYTVRIKIVKSLEYI